MKKSICLLLTLIFVLSLSTSANAHHITTNSTNLSEMTDEECVDFVKRNNIMIPDDYEELEWVNFIRETISIVEDNPNYIFAYNYSKTLAFANDIKDAVNAYYGNVIHDRITDDSVLPFSSSIFYSLQDSTLEVGWSDVFTQYNCYAYAMLKYDDSYDPGDFSGKYDLGISDDVYTIALAVKDDLQSTDINRQCVYITSVYPEEDERATDQMLIALRKGNVDYHFMREHDIDYWVHKPGDTNILRYNYLPHEKSYWTNEGVIEGIAYPPAIYYTSTVYYILHARFHNTVNMETGNHYHSGIRHFYEYADVCVKCHTASNHTWVSQVCSGPPCTLQFSNPPILDTY